VEVEPIMFEGRNAPERVTGDMGGLLRFSEAHPDQLVGGSLLLEPEQHAAQERAAPDAMDDRAVHLRFPFRRRSVICKYVLTLASIDGLGQAASASGDHRARPSR